MTAIEPKMADTPKTALVLGQGAREHALAEALAASPRVGRVVVAPGHAWLDVQAHGLSRIERITPETPDINGFVAIAELLRPDLIVVGPEQLLADGIVDTLTSKGFVVFGPTRAAARLETSKAETRRLVEALAVPTAATAIVRSVAEAAAALRTMPSRVVVKADGLAAGKGTWICNDHDTALGRVWRLTEGGELGDAGRTVLIESFIVGEESSVMAICDADTCLVLPTVRDWKRAGDGELGPNTGGLGAVAPWPIHDTATIEAIRATIFEPVLAELRAQGRPFRGCLYAGLIGTGANVRLLEFNARFGDPETQALLPLFDGDFYAWLAAAATDRLAAQVATEPLRWREGAAVAVVVAARGYPGPHEVHRVPARWLTPDGPVRTYAANLAEDAAGGFVNGGGRVVTLVSHGQTVIEALAAVDHAIGAVPDGFFRRMDIGRTGLSDTLSETSRDRVIARGITPRTYAEAGVDVGRAETALALAAEALRRGRGPRMMSRPDAYAGVVVLNDHPEAIAITIDGLGTKTLLAQTPDDWRQLGADLVHHARNDLLASGARPCVFVDQISAHRLDPALIAALLEGVADACEAADVALAGGETAEVPDLLKAGAVDVSGTLVGLLPRTALTTAPVPEVGDRVLALRSNGLHTNGFSLARRILADVLDTPMAPGQPTWRRWLLAPHRCYSNDIAHLSAAGVVPKGLVHVTGGAFRANPPRILQPAQAMALDPWPWPAPFVALAERGGVARDEMRAVFNLGVGMLVVVAAHQVELATATLPELWSVGRIVTRGANAPPVFWTGA